MYRYRPCLGQYASGTKPDTLTEWRNGKGFEVTANGSRVTINSVEISGNSVIITCASELPAWGVKVGYAFTGGKARLTEPTAGFAARLRSLHRKVRCGTAQFLCIFEMPVN